MSHAFRSTRPGRRASADWAVRGEHAAKRPADVPRGRWLADLEEEEEEGPLTKAERALVECCARGKPWVAKDCVWEDGKPQRPEEPSEANRIRASLIRFLALGGDALHPVHEDGVMCGGGWVTGTLDLHQCTAERRLDLKWCHIEEMPSLLAANLPELALTGSLLAKGLEGDRLTVKGGVFLKDGFEAQGEVRLLGATIGGDLECSSGAFHNPDGTALNADGLTVKGGVFLKDGFDAQGEVRLLGVTIGGDLDCCGGAFHNPDGKALNADGLTVKGAVHLADGFEAQGEVRLLGATIGGDLECSSGVFHKPDGRALNVNRLTVKGTLFLRKATVTGAINLAVAHIGTLNDDAACWKAGGHLLDGLHYDRIIGPMDARSRIAWLNSQHDYLLSSSHFAPQPWEQLAKVLREMGHTGAAGEVAIAKQEAMRKAGQIGQRHVKTFEGHRFRAIRNRIDRIWNPAANILSRIWHRTYGLLAGYGYRPQRIIYLTAALIGLSTFFFWTGAQHGLIGPSDPLIHLQPSLAHCGPDAFSWTSGVNCAVPPEYSTFQPFLYTIDVTLPLVDLHQEADWGPIVVDDRGNTLWGGRLLRWLMWFDIIFGWLASLMFVAIVSRLVEKD